MSVGHGRGFYGGAQLDREPKRKSGLWWKIAVVAGVGAVVWYVLPRKKIAEVAPPLAPQPPAPSLPVAQLQLVLASPPASSALDQLAQQRGFASAREYEEAVLGSIRELEAAGAKIMAPPFQPRTPPSRTEP
jgi:hypothetical protein